MNWNWETENEDYLKRTIQRCKENKIILPTFNQLKKPEAVPGVPDR